MFITPYSFNSFMTIYLIGLMGSGKTFIGKSIAKKLNYSFADLDSLIEIEIGKTVSEIFKTQGEVFFREKEKKTLNNLKPENIVISTGGGTACFFDNMDFMKENGFTIFLNPPLEIIYERLKNERNQRPIISNLTEDDFFYKIKELHTARIIYYQKADLEIVSENADEIIDAILKFISTKK